MIYVKTRRSAATRGVTARARSGPDGTLPSRRWAAGRAGWLRERALGAVVAIAMAVGLAAAPPATAQPDEGQPQQLPTVALTAGFHRVVAMVADSPAERSHGLMWRREMGANEGMLFVFDVATPQCFWMKNTLIPLAIAFVADDGTIVNIADMQPQSERSHCSEKPVRYALEMKQGWYAQRGIKAGFQLKGQPFGN